MSDLAKGLWAWQENGGTCLPSLVGWDGSLICNFGDGRNYYPTEGVPPDMAHALLIAAAPYLLQVLQGAYVVICEEVADGEHTALAGSIRAAIESATGVKP